MVVETWKPLAVNHLPSNSSLVTKSVLVSGYLQRLLYTAPFLVHSEAHAVDERRHINRIKIDRRTDEYWSPNTTPSDGQDVMNLWLLRSEFVEYDRVFEYCTHSWSSWLYCTAGSVYTPTWWSQLRTINYEQTYRTTLPDFCNSQESKGNDVITWKFTNCGV